MILLVKKHQSQILTLATTKVLENVCNISVFNVKLILYKKSNRISFI